MSPADETTKPSLYLPSRRESPETVRAQAALVAESQAPLLYGAHPVFTIILNASRQILYANASALELFGASSLEEVLGARPGEAAGCIHAENETGGCGTSDYCRFCGAAQGLALALAGEAKSEECTIVRDGVSERPETTWSPPTDSPRGGVAVQLRESLDLLVRTEPLALGGLELILMVAHDISAQKRREVLERVFYHDIANTAGGIRNILDIIQVKDEEPNPEYLALLKSASEQLVEEIVSQRAIKEAEEGALEVQRRKLMSLALVQEAVGLFSYYLYGRDIEIRVDGEDFPLTSDRALLRRVLGNMIKNALEASGRGSAIRVACEREGGAALFSVTNRGAMSEEARKRVFHRSFSTKGKGRGLGTYSMKLLAEGYLGGKVSFTSSAESGTTFRLELPLD